MSQERQPDGYIIILKGARNEVNQRYYLIPATREELNRFWECWAKHIHPPKQLTTTA